MLEIFGIPESLLPKVRDCAGDFGMTDRSILGTAIPVCGMAGDQQAALIGQAGFAKGMAKSTYGTGCFVIANTGVDPVPSHNKMLTTVAYRLQGEVTYGNEGSLFVAGSAIQWLRDQLQIIDHAADSEGIARATGVVKNIHVVPAFAGLGAPYWDPDARGAIVGLSRDSGRDEIVTATLQGIAYQTRDLVAAMREDGMQFTGLRVDGGMVANDWFLQFLADVLQIRVERPVNVESTVLGAASLAGLAAGLYADLDSLASNWQLDQAFVPSMSAAEADSLYAGWIDAVSRVRVRRDDAN